MTKVCRLCLSRLQRGSKYFNINAVESFTGFMPYRDQLTTCIPEMALDLIPSPVICNNCRTALKSSYDFKFRCLMVEKKIKEYVESLPLETTDFDLSVIDTSDLPKITRIATAAEIEQAKKDTNESRPKFRIEKKQESQEEHSRESSLLSNLLTLKKEEILAANSSKGSPQRFNNTPESSPRSAAIVQKALQNSNKKEFQCNHCEMSFSSVPALHSHKQNMHEEEFLCNFCNHPFRSLQNLRKHNIVCQKISQSESGQPVSISSTILTKRPHLPMKAKNHLKKWLFRHTDHPYPTDVEKQQLMKETGLSLLQVENWFINARRRILGDLTKLKNMRGRNRQRTRPPKVGADFDNDDILDLDNEDKSLVDPSDLLEVPLSALKKLNDTIMDIDMSEEGNNTLDEDRDSAEENSSFESSSMLQISNVEGGVDTETDEGGGGKNGDGGRDPLAGSSENSEEAPEIPLTMNVKMEIEENELPVNKKSKLFSVKQEPRHYDEDANSSE